MATESLPPGMPARASHCSACGHLFEENESIWSALLPSEARGPQVRRDHCATCWKAVTPGGAIWWRGSAAKGNAAEAARQKEQGLLALVQGEEPNPEEAGSPQSPEEVLARRYAAALALWRLRKLRLEQVIPAPTGEILRFRLSGSQKRFDVAHPGISEDRLRNMEEDLLRTVPGGYAPPVKRAA